jgi:glycosyltransferase involved in cell wall biosynthesis
VTVGFHSPLPPARTGVADYSAALLSALRRRGNIEVDAHNADVDLYHIGNNPLHREIYKRAITRPGVAVLHDAVLNHFFLGSLNETEYIAEFVYNYGEWHREFAHELWRDRASSGSDHRYFERPMLRRIAEVSRSVIVHNPAAARMVREHAPNARVIEIPHFFEPPAHLPDVAATLRFREKLSVPPGAVLFGVLGYLRESKRPFSVVHAFQRLRDARPGVFLLFAGEIISSDLKRALAPSLEEPGILRLGHLPECDFWVAASALDACINLRDPAAGETSGIAIQLMGTGKPVMVTANSENSAWPPAECLRIESGLAEEQDLFDHMILVANFPELAREIGWRAAQHIRRHHALELAAGRYWEILCDSRG